MTQSTSKIVQAFLTRHGHVSRIVEVDDAPLNLVPADYSHTCRRGEACRAYRITAGSELPYAWMCQIRSRIGEGYALDCPVGNRVVRVRCTRPDAAYNVETIKCGPIPGYGEQVEHEGLFSAEVEARAYARSLVLGLREVERLVA